MKILFLLPENTKHTSGNWITAQRISKGLAKLGLLCDIIEVNHFSENLAKQYDLIHCFHVWKSAKAALAILKKLDIPWVVTFTGTDLELCGNESQFQELREILLKTSKIFVFHQQAKADLLKYHLADEKLIAVIPQTVLPFPEGKQVNFRSKLSLAAEDFVFLFAGGIRAVKDPLLAVKLLQPLAAKYPQVKLILAGSILEKETYRELMREINLGEWVTYIGEIPHSQIKDLILAADAVINTSRWEGMPNTLLEAMSLGRIIIARDIPGNRAIVEHGEDGLLFGADTEFLLLAEKILNDAGRRNSLKAAARKKGESFNIYEEAKAYLRGYGLDKLAGSDCNVRC